MAPLIELLDALWAIPIRRVADELWLRGRAGAQTTTAELTDEDRRLVAEFAAFVAARPERGPRTPGGRRR